MTHAIIALLAAALGVITTIAYFAARDARHRMDGIEKHDALTRKHIEAHQLALDTLTAKQREHHDALYKHEQDLQTAARLVPFGRYGEKR